MLVLEYQIPLNTLDSQYQHLHHARALEFLERCRLELLERIGHSSASLIEQDLYPVVTRIEVEYRREIKGGPITVSCESGEVSGKRMYIKQRILNERGKPAVEAFIECAFLQGASKRAVPVPVAVRVALEQFFHQ